jgi:hypothetical protein
VIDLNYYYYARINDTLYDHWLGYVYWHVLDGHFVNGNYIYLVVYNVGDGNIAFDGFLHDFPPVVD